MTTFKQFLKEEAIDTDPMVKVTFNWDIDGEFKSAEEALRHEFTPFFAHQISIEEYIDQVSFNKFEVTLMGDSSKMFPLLADMFTGVKLRGAGPQFVFVNSTVDVAQCVDAVVESFGKILATPLDIWFYSCTMAENLSRLVGDEYTVDFNMCFAGSKTDNTKIDPIVTKYVRHEIDAFDFQDQMVNLGFEKYL